MKLYLISLVIAITCLLPEVAAMRDWEPNVLFSVINIPATGLGYMAVFFHEIGHAVAWWIFGSPALPSFDFQYGGGMTYPIGHYTSLLVAVYVGFAAAIGWAGYNRLWALAAGLVVALGCHIALNITAGHEVFAGAMGHGGEVLIAAFCIIRAGTGETEGGFGERYLSMVFGLFTMLKNLLLPFALVTDEIYHAVYTQQKGGHMMGDYDAVADQLDISLKTLCLWSIGTTLLVFAAALLLAVLLPKRQSNYALRDV